MIATFTALLLAHALADFVLQTSWMVSHKRKPQVLLLHGAVVLLTAQAALGNVSAWPLVALAVAHIAIDTIKTFGMPDGKLWAYLADQAAHLTTLAGIAVLFPDLWEMGVWGDVTWLPAVFAVLAGLILTVRAGGFAIGMLMAPYADTDLPKGLENGGALIGVLERGMILLLLLVGQPTGVGFLIAAKSVLRFDTTSGNQSAAEYVIIGTLASFGWALVCGYGTLALLSQLPPLGIPLQTP